MIHSSIGEPLILSNYLDTSTVKLIRAFLFSSNRFFGNLCSTTTIQRYALGPIIAADEAGHKTPQQKYVHT